MLYGRPDGGAATAGAGAGSESASSSSAAPGAVGFLTGAGAGGLTRATVADDSCEVECEAGGNAAIAGAAGLIGIAAGGGDISATGAGFDSSVGALGNG